MKKILLYIPIVLSLIVLGAHFMRDGSELAVIGTLFLIALLLVRQAWVARLMQAVLVLGAIEWILTLNRLAHVREALDQPYARMVAILGVVAAVTLCSALLFQTTALKEIYRHTRREIRNDD